MVAKGIRIPVITKSAPTQLKAITKMCGELRFNPELEKADPDDAPGGAGRNGPLCGDGPKFGRGGEGLITGFPHVAQ